MQNYFIYWGINPYFPLLKGMIRGRFYFRGFFIFSLQLFYVMLQKIIPYILQILERMCIYLENKECKCINIECKAHRAQANWQREFPIRRHHPGGDGATYLAGRKVADNFHSFHALWDFASLLFGNRHWHLGKGLYFPMLCFGAKTPKYYSIYMCSY